MAIIDTHNHLYFPSFKANLADILTDSQTAGVKQQIIIGIDELSCQAALNLAAQHSVFKVALGLHPCDVDQLGIYHSQHHQYLGLNETLRPQLKSMTAYFDWIEKQALAHQDLVVAFGETGFDKFHRQSRLLLKQQTESFEAHLTLCQKQDKTLIIHSRGAAKETVNFIKTNQDKFKAIRFVWHCFTEDETALKTVLDLGGYIGVGGVITYPKSADLRNTLKRAPLNALLTETDAPFLTPHQARKKQKLNQPNFIPEIIAAVAELKSMGRESMEDQLYRNALLAFKLD